MKNKLIEVKNLSKHFSIGHGHILKAVDDVTFDIYENETLGLVGESGCGKTTLGRTLTILYGKTSGSVKYRGKSVNEYSTKDLAKNFQIIFQDPDASLNPRMCVGDIIAEGLDIFKLCKTPKERLHRVHHLLEQVGLNKEHINRFPHEFSGGQKQRIGIARALAVEPKFVVCDEAISALDVSIQAQVVNLLKKIQTENGLTFLFIAHDLSMVKYISDRIGVMYLGNLVELAESDKLNAKPLHPYTVSLLASIPKIEDLKGESAKKKTSLKGEIPSPGSVFPGCKFAMRCPKAKEICSMERPQLKEVEKDHFASCHLY